MEKEFKAIYGQAMSIVTHKPSQYAKILHYAIL